MSVILAAVTVTAFRWLSAWGGTIWGRPQRRNEISISFIRNQFIWGLSARSSELWLPLFIFSCSTWPGKFYILALVSNLISGFAVQNFELLLWSFPLCVVMDIIIHNLICIQRIRSDMRRVLLFHAFKDKRCFRRENGVIMWPCFDDTLELSLNWNYDSLVAAELVPPLPGSRYLNRSLPFYFSTVQHSKFSEWVLTDPCLSGKRGKAAATGAGGAWQ